MLNVEYFDFQHFDAAAGSIVIAQGEIDLPFSIRRIYYIYGVPPDQTRGAHAHKQLTQIAVCVSGSCKFRLDDGTDTIDVELDTPHQGIVMRPMLWHEMSHFSSDCVLLVFANEYYDAADYIRDYDEFKRAVTIP
jgi:dTDP-4-dehydrorhamnose 3,5-epimerase-like enzyme